VNKNIKEALKEMMEIISKRVPQGHKKKDSVNIYIAGGIATYFYSATRVSRDVDAILSHNVRIPTNLSVYWENESGEMEELVYDHGFMSLGGILPEGYETRAYLQYEIDNKLKVYILSPEDLILSKLIRFADHDEADIKSIVANSDAKKEKFRKLAEEYIEFGVGFRKQSAKINLEHILEIFDRFGD